MKMSSGKKMALIGKMRMKMKILHKSREEEKVDSTNLVVIERRERR